MSKADVTSRRFGPTHPAPCADPETITCALAECQERNRCKRSFNLPPGPEADKHAFYAHYMT